MVKSRRFALLILLIGKCCFTLPQTNDTSKGVVKLGLIRSIGTMKFIWA
jgi:hypothetical protein